MLNMLRFRDWADYSGAPAIEPPHPFTGEAAYERYIELAMPHVVASGGTVQFAGRCRRLLIGPTDEQWDRVMLVGYDDVRDFIGMARHEAYMATVGHRNAAVSDSRLLPVIPMV
jgi:hypothetical protein